MKVGEFTGINAKKEVAEIIKYHQDEGLWESPVSFNLSMKTIMNLIKVLQWSIPERGNTRVSA